MSLDGEGDSEAPVYGSALWNYYLRTGACTEHHLGDNVRGAEPVFAPASDDLASDDLAGDDLAGDDSGEDEGWVISLKHDNNSNESCLVIIDAQNFSAPPVATIHLPRRVPYGAHASWVPDSTMN